MRWEDLFDDLEAQFDAAGAADFAAEVSDRTRREVASLRLVDRLAPSIGRTLQLRVLGVGPLEGRLNAVGPDWLLLAEPRGRETLIAIPALLSAVGLSTYTAAPASPGPQRPSARVAAGLNLRYALRSVVRDRSALDLTLIDGLTISGTADRVGADFVEVAEHPAGEPRRPGVVQRVRTVPIAALALVRRR